MSREGRRVGDPEFRDGDTPSLPVYLRNISAAASAKRSPRRVR